MGAIIPRKRADGSTAYTAQIILKRDRKIVHRETKTFDRGPAAAAWIKKRETELSKPGAVQRPTSEVRHLRMTLIAISLKWPRRGFQSSLCCSPLLPQKRVCRSI
jgi:hypothetical protein